MRKELKLILEALELILDETKSSTDRHFNKKVRILQRIRYLLNPKKSEFPEVKETLEEKNG